MSVNKNNPDEKMQKTYTIQDIPVNFPHDAYSLQISLMNQIIKSLKNQENCLLESPTGSGKSLAFLCAALAWQRQEKFLKRNINNNNDDQENLIKNDHNQKLEDSRPSTSIEPPEKRFKSILPTFPSLEINVPKIFYCTRTHKQISQIVRDLEKTSYREVKMCILSSREKTCIHPEISQEPKNKKDEKCRELVKDSRGCQCPYYYPAFGLNHKMIKDQGLNFAWEMEELVKMGQELKLCPYYGVCELMKSSDLIFCPYNYIIDPLIRSRLKIFMDQQIIILDEGHNVEDIAREIGSFTVNEEELKKMIQDLEFMIDDHHDVKLKDIFEEWKKKEKKIPIFYQMDYDELRQEKLYFAKLFSKILTWMFKLFSHKFSDTTKILAGPELVDILTDFGAGPQNLIFLENALDKLSGEIPAQNNHEVCRNLKNDPACSSETLRIGRDLISTLNFLYRDNLKFVEDYVAVIVNSHHIMKTKSNFMVAGPSSRKPHSSPLEKPSQKFLTLNIWCLNPGVVFSEFQNVHSLIISSGTLAPLTSFQSELNLNFPNTFEAKSHVIDKSQIWVGTIHSGPNNLPLKVVFQNTESLDFQDELGETVLQICHSVPSGGILCFFSSYHNLEKMHRRWEFTGLLNKIRKIKYVIMEPRENELEERLAKFYSAVEKTGALFLAVFRGKVSEGLNFSDQNARAVITIGIPYPNLKDLQIELKRKYNNAYKSKTRLLMSGHEWYEAQAFRALNQALGRCIRHKNDWGALILIDQRFQTNPSYTRSLPKWVRPEMQQFKNLTEAMESLEHFIKCQKNGQNQS